ncbi:uncharacterized protein DUF2236 [Tamaricihabitans halophyticus]|uniref:Uncharacterized protein DUF2236 n=1 Tax=Tamaricihabitans halophyticus TaxID=1262583 RepID=A0A4R2R5H3_9PSEU|nr:oxygenase MpaB family protein [Tamaricihabitans halophyticus]TCP57277.1 uncharacterized protein DUF2236 [Tamaricihabitans halophyticus]
MTEASAEPATTAELPEPQMFRDGPLRLASMLLMDGNARPDHAQVARLRELAQTTDPLADAVVAAIRELPPKTGHAMFERALTDGIDAIPEAPPAFHDFFRSVEATPYWLDRGQLEAGARAITRTGLWGLFPLGDMSLMGGYLASRATKTLVGTGEIEYMANRRLVETATWWIDVTTPGALEPHALGYVSALRVRLVHAYVRAAMHKRDDWDYESWDQPINQVQTVGTLLLFSKVFLLGTRALGIRYTAKERAAILHLWRYVGWLMGVTDELLPVTEKDCWRLLWLLDATEFSPDEDSRRLATALLKTHEAAGSRFGPLAGVVGQASVRLHGAISRLTLGKRHADFLGLPNDPLVQATVLGLAATTFVTETTRRWLPGATRLQERFGSLTRRQYVEQLGNRFNPDRTYTARVQSADRAA